jgi:hypothetical protein
MVSDIPKEMMMAICFKCSKPYPDERKVLGYSVCLVCGDELAHERKHTIAPMNKSNYMLFTDASLLKQLNPKRTT